MIINTMEKINDSYEEVGYPEIKFGAFNSQSIKCYSSRHCFAVYIMEFEDSLSLVNEASTDQTLLVHEDSMTWQKKKSCIYLSNTSIWKA